MDFEAESFQGMMSQYLRDGNSPDTSSDLNAGKGRSKVHWAWRYFKTVPNPEGKHPNAQCLLCGGEVRWAGSTNITKHMRRHHTEKVPLEDRRPRTSKTLTRSLTHSIDDSHSFDTNDANGGVSSPTGGSPHAHTGACSMPASSEAFNVVMDHEATSSPFVPSEHASADSKNGACETIHNQEQRNHDALRHLAMFHAAYPIGNPRDELFMKFCAFIPGFVVPPADKLNAEADFYCDRLEQETLHSLTRVHELSLSCGVIQRTDGSLVAAISAHFIHPTEDRIATLWLRSSELHEYSNAVANEACEGVLADFDLSGKMTKIVFNNMNRSLVNKAAKEIFASNDAGCLKATGIQNEHEKSLSGCNNHLKHTREGRRYNFVSLNEGFEDHRFMLCVASEIHYVVQHAVDTTHRVNVLLDKVYGTLHKLAATKDALAAYCKRNNMGVSVPVTFSWNSVLPAVQQIILTRVSINEICEQFAWETWTEQEITDLEAFHEFMKQPAELLRVISSDDQETISMVFPTVQALIEHFKKGINGESTSELAQTLHDAFIDHFDFILKSGSPDSDPIYLVACLLDRKTSWLMTDKERTTAANALVEILSAGRQADEDALVDTGARATKDDMPCSNDSSAQLVFDSPFGDFARERLSGKSYAGNGEASKERAEVERYIREHATVVVSNNFSSVQFWSANQWIYPRISSIAPSILLSPASSLTLDGLLASDVRFAESLQTPTTALHRRGLIVFNKWLLSM